jgi:hypothetical protein
MVINKNIQTLIVGGNFGDEPKSSSVVTKIANQLEITEVINGGTLDSLPHEMNMDLILWMPNITNESPKQYPKKGNGNVLICSKVMRDGYTVIDAVSRIFKMRGNAVIVYILVFLACVGIFYWAVTNEFDADMDTNNFNNNNYRY